MCQTLINAVEGYYIIGASLLKHYYSVWDLGGKRLGFASNGELKFFSYRAGYWLTKRCRPLESGLEG